jgi:hypothetical protein
MVLFNDTNSDFWKQHQIVEQILCFWTLSIVLSLSKNRPVYFFKTQRFGDWILSPSSGKTYSVGPNG